MQCQINTLYILYACAKCTNKATLTDNTWSAPGPKMHGVRYSIQPWIQVDLCYFMQSILALIGNNANTIVVMELDITSDVQACRFNITRYAQVEDSFFTQEFTFHPQLHHCRLVPVQLIRTILHVYLLLQVGPVQRVVQLQLVY